MYGLSKAALFATLMLISLGWGITFHRLGYRKYFVGGIIKLVVMR